MMRTKTAGHLLYFVLLLALITSCKSSKPTTGTKAADNTSAINYLESVLNNAPAFDSFTSKMHLTANLGGKGLTISGTLKMKKNDAIQLSFAPLLGIEVARIEITPEHILIIDRLNKRYVQVPVSYLKSLGNSELDFYALQSLFYNELFIPGVRTVTSKNLPSLLIRKGADDETVVQIKESKVLNLSFITTTSNARLTECNISTSNNFSFNWKYAAFVPFSGKTFPSQMNITLLNNSKMATLAFELSKMNRGNNESLRTEVPKKYKQMDINDLINQLLNL